MLPYRRRLDTVGIDGPLSKKGYRIPFQLFLERAFEHIDEDATYEFPFLFGIRDTLKTQHELTARINNLQILEATRTQYSRDALGLTFAQETSVDQHGMQTSSDGLVQERSRDEGVDAARESDEYMFRANLSAYACDDVVRD